MVLNCLTEKLEKKVKMLGFSTEKVDIEECLNRIKEGGRI